MNGHPPSVIENQHDDLEDVASPVWAKDQEAIRGVVIAEIIGNQ